MREPARRALVVGKFLPPHRGHHDLIRYAGSQAEHVTVLVVDGHGEHPDAGTRAGWLAGEHPDADVIVAADQCRHGTSACPPECSPTWAAHILRIHPEPIDAVVSSETYGPLLAAALGARHIAYDPDRQRAPISGTAVRADLGGNWDQLTPRVRAGLTRRVVIMGAESTGTTTLVRDLAAAGGFAATVEAGRTMSAMLAARAGGIEHVDWTPAVFWRILSDQRRNEADAAWETALREPHPALGAWVVADTDAVATIAWWERYVDVPVPDALGNYAQAGLADLYIVTSPDGVEFSDDGLRDGEHLREQMHTRFVELAEWTGQPWLVVAGGREERVQAALDAMEDLEHTLPRFATTDNAAWGALHQR